MERHCRGSEGSQGGARQGLGEERWGVKEGEGRGRGEGKVG